MVSFASDREEPRRGMIKLVLPEEREGSKSNTTKNAMAGCGRIQKMCINKSPCMK